MLLLDGAMVAYGGGWEKEETLQLPAVTKGTHTISLGVVSDTGGATWKRDSDLCVIQSHSFAVEDDRGEGGGGGVIHEGVGTITWPPHGSRLLGLEIHSCNAYVNVLDIYVYVYAYV